MNAVRIAITCGLLVSTSETHGMFTRNLGTGLGKYAVSARQSFRWALMGASASGTAWLGARAWATQSKLKPQTAGLKSANPPKTKFIPVAT